MEDAKDPATESIVASKLELQNNEANVPQDDIVKLRNQLAELQEEISLIKEITIPRLLKESSEQIDKYTQRYEDKIDKQEGRNTQIVQYVVIGTFIAVLGAIAGTYVDIATNRADNLSFYYEVQRDRFDGMTDMIKIQQAQDREVTGFMNSIQNQWEVFKAKNPKLNY